MEKRSRLTYAQKQCLGAVGKLMQQGKMIYPGARIGVAASGGVDSWLMLKILTMRQAIVPFKFDIMALHLNPGFDPDNHAPLADWLKKNRVSGHVESTDYGIRGHSKENRQKSACFYCAKLRRKRLFELCAKYRLTHLALGHTADDLTATFFMNLMHSGSVYGLAIKESFFQGELTLIRPLMLLRKKTIIKAAKDFTLPVWQNDCPSAENTSRAATEDWLKKHVFSNAVTAANVTQALQRWQLDKMNKID